MNIRDVDELARACDDAEAEYNTTCRREEKYEREGGALRNLYLEKRAALLLRAPTEANRRLLQTYDNNIQVIEGHFRHLQQQSLAALARWREVHQEYDTAIRLVESFKLFNRRR